MPHLKAPLKRAEKMGGVELPANKFKHGVDVMSNEANAESEIQHLVCTFFIV